MEAQLLQQKLEKVVFGSQHTRAVELIFTEDYIYYGSDSEIICNSIFRINRKTSIIERLVGVSGPIFYGCKIGEHLFFSSVVEPSEINTSCKSEIYYSRDGENWIAVCAFTKDKFSKKFFQYGQIVFPRGPGDGKHLWFTPYATEGDGDSYCMPLASL